MTELQEPFHTTGFADWRRKFPWLHLLRVPGIAARPHLLLVGFVASAMLMAIRTTLPNSSTLQIEFGSNAWLNSARFLALQLFPPNFKLANIGTELFNQSGQWPVVAQDSLELFIWLIAGLVVSRLAAGLFTQEKMPCLRQAALFSLKKLPALLTAFLFPLLSLLALWLLIGGLLRLEWIPVAGPWLAAISYGGVLFLTALLFVLYGLFLIGWPLLVASLATENSDGFDAWSRSLDYLRSRLLPIIIASTLTLALGYVAWSIAALMSGPMLQQLDFWQAEVTDASALEINLRNMGTDESSPQLDPLRLQAVWRLLWRFVLSGYLISLYWTTITSVYVLMRHSVDRTPLNEFKG